MLKITAYEQEFTEASDGIIELPRIVAGYDPDNMARWAEINELVLHYVNTLYFHPNDVLDNGIKKNQTWDFLRDQFEENVKWINSSAPGLREYDRDEKALRQYSALRGWQWMHSLLKVPMKYRLETFMMKPGLCCVHPGKPGAVAGRDYFARCI